MRHQRSSLELRITRQKRHEQEQWYVYVAVYPYKSLVLKPGFYSKSNIYLFQAHWTKLWLVLKLFLLGNPKILPVYKTIKLIVEVSCKKSAQEVTQPIYNKMLKIAMRSTAKHKSWSQDTVEVSTSRIETCKIDPMSIDYKMWAIYIHIYPRYQYLNLTDPNRSVKTYQICLFRNIRDRRRFNDYT